jgi:tRNA(Ile)-lysidine synthase
MINILGKIPRKVMVACSGGVDSMAVVDFLLRKHTVELLFVHHNTLTSCVAYDFLSKYAISRNLKLHVHFIDAVKPARVSQEEHWRNERYKFFHSYDKPVITCHHLDDCVETWVWSSMHGEGKLIPHTNANVIRPFLSTRKAKFINWCTKNNVAWVEDASNDDTKYTRNYIRHELLPMVLKINPGIHKTIAKKVKKNNE